MEKSKFSHLSDQELLKTRVCDLSLSLPRKYKAEITRLNNLLREKKILWKPHYWFSNEWFCPDGVAGIAIPYTLCDPKLVNIEKRYLGFSEGEKPQDFFKLLCHETGHAIDNAYRLRRKKYRQALFGKTSKTYPSSYRPNPYSKDYVFYLDDYYAQAHPDEDWAETFAVWLSTKDWRKKYQGTKALLKLLYIDDLMQEIRENPFYKNEKKQVESYLNDKGTVANSLNKKRKSLKLNRELFSEHIIKRGFSSTSGQRAAVQFIQRREKHLINSLHEKTQIDKWTLRKCLLDIIATCKQNGYKLTLNEKKTEEFLFEFIEVHIEDFIRLGRTKVYM